MKASLNMYRTMENKPELGGDNMLDKPLGYSRDELHQRVLNNLNNAVKMPMKLSNLVHSSKASEGEDSRNITKMHNT